ncbi:MAG: MMPL family transporter, partial [Sphingomonadales bacterium]|nr:MMPL family transporter [Sphingomonadales bacterium]
SRSSSPSASSCCSWRGYYRFAGLVACFALTLNLLVTVAFMVLFQAPFTLPGLAGLVLTVAMSVDANILISERMREELARGARSAWRSATASRKPSPRSWTAT